MNIKTFLVFNRFKPYFIGILFVLYSYILMYNYLVGTYGERKTTGSIVKTRFGEDLEMVINVNQIHIDILFSTNFKQIFLVQI